MTLDEAQRLAEILIARQVPAMNDAGFGHSWKVDVETGRVFVEVQGCETADLFLGLSAAPLIDKDKQFLQAWARGWINWQPQSAAEAAMMASKRPAEMQDDGA